MHDIEGLDEFGDGSIRFGDDGEFIYESCIEEVDPATDAIREATIIFRRGQEVRALHLLASSQAAEASEAPEDTVDTQDIITMPHIDVTETMRVLGYTSATLLNISTPVELD